MPDKQGNQQTILRIALGALIIILILRVAPMLRFFLFGIFVLLIVAGIVYLIWRYSNAKTLQKKESGTVEGMTNAKIRHCDEQIAKNENEAGKIKKSIASLQKELQISEGLSAAKKKELKRLLEGFEGELKLRYAKLDFFRSAKKKLKKIQRNKQVDQAIAAKEEELKRLKEGHYEDLADMEALRSDMELETLYLDTIESLSLKLNDSNSLESVQSLHKELEAMTKDLEGGEV